jgi:hypothetical protein
MYFSFHVRPFSKIFRRLSVPAVRRMRVVNHDAVAETATNMLQEHADMDD